MNQVISSSAEPAAFEHKEPMYDTGGSGRRLRGWTPGISGPNSAIIYGAPEMRNRSRDLSRKFPLLAGAYATISSNIVESGIRALPKSENKSARKVIKDAWEIWQKECDIEGVHYFQTLQDLLVRERYEAGEVFIRHHHVNSGEGLLIPYQIQVLEAEYVPYEMNEILANGNKIIAGIEFNASGKRVAYHMYPEHPGDGIVYKTDMTIVRVPADEVIHYFKALRAGQVRGIPECFSAQAKARDVMVYSEAELVKKQTASLLAGFITSPEGDQLNANPYDIDADPGEAIAKIEPGSIMSLEPGEDITFNNPVESGSSYDPFMKRTYSEVAAALNMSYEEFSLDVSGISFSSIRAVLNQSQRKYRQEQARFIIVLESIWKQFFNSAVLAGVFNFPDYLDDPRKYTRVIFQAPGWAYVNPQQEIAAVKEEIKAGLTSRERVAAERGNDIEEVDEQIARDKERAAAMGLGFDVDMNVGEATSATTGDKARNTKSDDTATAENDSPDSENDTATAENDSPDSKNDSPDSDNNSSTEKLSFNGAQVTAMLTVVLSAARGELPRDSALAILKSVFGLEQAAADEIMGSIGDGFVPLAQDNTTNIIDEAQE